MAKKLNIEIEQGATFTYTIELLNENNSEFDVTNWTGSGQIRKHYKSNVYYSFNIALSNGNMSLSMNASVTNSIPYGLYVYDAEISTNTGEVKRIMSGMVEVTPQITK